MITSIFESRCTGLLLWITVVAFGIESCQGQSPSQTDTPIAFMQEALDLANQLRAIHQSGPLQLNLSLSAESEAWAKKIGAQCDKVGKATAYYSRVAGVGENVWVTDSMPEVSGGVPVQAWYDQAHKHNWTNNIFNYDTAQFSTLVWKATNQFGIAKFKTPLKGYIMVVARFLPQGNSNYYSSFAANVIPPVTTTPPTVTPPPFKIISGYVTPGTPPTVTPPPFKIISGYVTPGTPPTVPSPRPTIISGYVTPGTPPTVTPPPLKIISGYVTPGTPPTVTPPPLTIISGYVTPGTPPTVTPPPLKIISGYVTPGTPPTVTPPPLKIISGYVTPGTPPTVPSPRPTIISGYVTPGTPPTVTPPPLKIISGYVTPGTPPAFTIPVTTRLPFQEFPGSADIPATGPETGAGGQVEDEEVVFIPEDINRSQYGK